MLPDDPRHGKRTGYQAGCREECCRRPQRVALKLYRMGRTPQRIDPTGTRRRIEALLAMGWSAREIAEECGRTSRNWAMEVRKSSTVIATTAERIRLAYDELTTREPAGRLREKTRAVARANGYHPPEAWFDIDDPNEQPDPGWREQPRGHDELDFVVVERILAGDFTLAPDATKAEREAVVEAWTGASNELARLTRWKVERYRKDGAA